MSKYYDDDNASVQILSSPISAERLTIEVEILDKENECGILFGTYRVVIESHSYYGQSTTLVFGADEELPEILEDLAQQIRELKK